MKKLRWVLALGIVACLAAFVFLTANREESFFADTIPMLRGKGDWGEAAKVYDYHASTPKPAGKRRTKDFILNMTYPAACRQLEQELARKIPMIKKTPTTQGSGIATYAGGPAIPRGSGNESFMIILQELSDKTTGVIIVQTSELSWAERISMWWSNLRGTEKKPSAMTHF